jgi:hypothetical protein
MYLSTLDFLYISLKSNKNCFLLMKRSTEKEYYRKTNFYIKIRLLNENNDSCFIFLIFKQI